MASVDFLRKPFELAKSSQQVIERLVEIGQENAIFHVPVTSAFSSFAVLYDFIVYEAGIRVALQDFVLARFDLQFPAYSEIGVATPETELSRSWFMAPAVPLLFNILVQTAPPRPERVSLAKKEPPFLTRQQPEPPKTQQKAVPKSAGESEHVTIVNRVIRLQTELASELFPGLEAVASTLFESQKQAMRIASVVSMSKPALLKNTLLSVEPVGEKVVASRIAVPQEKMDRAPFPRAAPETTKEEPPKTSWPSIMPSAVVGVTVAPQMPEAMAYVYGLPILLLENQKLAATTKALSTSATTSTRQIKPSMDTSAESESAQDVSLKRSALPMTSWIVRMLSPFLESLRELSQFPVTAPTIGRLLTDVLNQRIQSPETLQTLLEAATAERRVSRGTGMRADERETEAARLPVIVATILSSYLRKSPTPFVEFPITEPFMKHEYALKSTRKRQFHPEWPGSEQPRVESELTEAEGPSELQVSRALATTEKMPEEKRRYEPAAFIAELQKVMAIYRTEMTGLAATGPLRATMLQELAQGVLVPAEMEEYTPEESAFSGVSESPAFPSQPTTSTRLTHTFPEEESVNVNVFTETADENFRELERKVGRILSEQLVNSGAARSFSPAGLSWLDSQAIPSTLLGQVNISERTINLRVLTEAADEDLRDLERKIRRILSAQISRYYGSSKP